MDGLHAVREPISPEEQAGADLIDRGYDDDGFVRTGSPSVVAR
jgi:hypothetical protein